MRFVLDWIVPALLVVMLLVSAIRMAAEDPRRTSHFATAGLIAIYLLAVLLPVELLLLKFLLLPVAIWVLLKGHRANSRIRAERKGALG